jgi:DNA-binding XRE family transcriptional regulator
MQSTVRDVAPQAGETLAKYIQRLRAESTSTQKELSLRAGVHIQTIRKIETGLTSIGDTSRLFGCCRQKSSDR